MTAYGNLHVDNLVLRATFYATFYDSVLLILGRRKILLKFPPGLLPARRNFLSVPVHVFDETNSFYILA